MASAFGLGIDRILQGGDFRSEAITCTERMIQGDLDPQMYLIASNNGAPAAIEIQNGFFKGTISLSTREYIDISGTSRGRFSTEATQAQRVGLLYLASPSAGAGSQLDLIANKRPVGLSFTIFQATPGGKLAAPGQQFAVKWTEVYGGVEISAIDHPGNTILMSCTYLRRQTTYISADPNVTGRNVASFDYQQNTFG